MVHSKPSRLGTALSAMSMRLVLGFTWFLACAYLGSQLIVGAVASHFRLVSISLPLVILLWVILFFCGRWLLGLLADRVSSQLAKETVTKARKNTSEPEVSTSWGKKGQVVEWAYFPDLPNLFEGISMRLVPNTFEVPSNADLESMMRAKTNFAPPIEIAALQPDVTASTGALRESPTNAPGISKFAMRHAAYATTVSYPGRPLWNLASPQHLQIGRRRISTISDARPNLGTARATIAPTIGVPERDFAPELSGKFGELLHPKA